MTAAATPVRSRRHHALRAIATREVRLAMRRRVVRWLLGLSLLPVFVFGTVLVVRLWGERHLGASLSWDPVGAFLRVQVLPVGLLALAIGAPSIARDRAHDVLFLYATRPVLPVDYALGKWISAALPCGALLLVPATLLAALRWGLLPEVTAIETAGLLARGALASLLLGAAVAGVCVGASAATRRDRDAILLALALFFGPDIALGIAGAEAPWAGAPGATRQLLWHLFDEMSLWAALGPALSLAAWGAGGAVVATYRVREEMVP